MIRVRFAPSPTGYLHVGGLRQALYNYLMVKKQGGNFILRIEDTDRKRFVPGSIESLIKILNWAGLEYDEGPELKDGLIADKGKFGPYIQSKRLELYHQHAQGLIDSNHAYYCFCDEQRLDNLRREQALNKQPTRYDGCCRNLSPEEVKKLLDNKVPYVVRFKNPTTGVTKIEDLIRGEVVWQNETLDDQILLKNDGFPTYHLASVVDDHLMEITHVLRSEEWLPSTPKHLLTYQAFGWQPPQFAHLSLVLNADRSKLSKRQGDVAVEDYQKNGYLPQALLNFVALLGWNPGGDKEIMSVKEMADLFDLRDVNKAGAIFDLDKLNWFNGEYIKKMPLDELVKFCRPYLEAIPGVVFDDKIFLKIVKTAQSRLKTLAEIASFAYLLNPEINYETELLKWKKADLPEAKEVLKSLVGKLQEISEADWQLVNLEKAVEELKQEKSLGTGNVLWPWRVALSGLQFSPGPYELADILGREKTLIRINQAIDKI